MKCPVCGNEETNGNFWEDAVSWGCSCGYYEDSFHGPSFPLNEFGIRQVEEGVSSSNLASPAN
jgi:hypothetical protein